METSNDSTAALALIALSKADRKQVAPRIPVDRSGRRTSKYKGVKMYIL